MKTISQQTIDNVIDISQKFTKGTKTVSANDPTYAKSKNKQVDNVNQKASKIVPLQEDGTMNDLLVKICSLLKRNYETDVKNREKMANFAEERELESQKRHDKLLDAIKQLTKNMGTAERVAPDEEDVGGGGFSWLDLLGLFGTGKTGFDVLKTILTGARALIVSPIGAAVIGGLAVGGLIKYLQNLQEEDKAKNPEKYKNVPNEVAKETGETRGQVGQRQAAEARKEISPQYARDLINSKLTDAEIIGETGYTRKELEDYVKTNPKTNLKPKKAVEMPTPVEAPEQTATPVTPEAPASVPSTEKATPETPVVPMSKVNQVIGENNQMKLDQMEADSEPVVITTGGTSVDSSSPEKPSILGDKIPSVRNMEETFQRMVLYSIRVV
jgi:hypothetical protein